MTVLEQDLSTFVEEWRDWHQKKEAERRRPHGFLAYSGFHFLDGVQRRFPGLPGVWSTGDEGPVVELADGETLVIDGRVVTGAHRWGAIAERSRHTASFGDAAAEVSRRGGYDLVRPIDPAHPLRLNYRGTPTFPPDPRWVIEGSSSRSPRPRTSRWTPRSRRSGTPTTPRGGSGSSTRAGPTRCC